jgi:hypothetical protein
LALYLISKEKTFVMRYFSLLILSMTMVSCQKGESQPFSGDPYMGSVHVRIEADGYKTKRDEGSGSAHFVDSAGKFAKLVVFGAIKDTAGDAGFSLGGVYTEKGWASDAASTRFRIDDKGVISGSGSMPGNKISFSGTATSSNIDLIVKMVSLESTAGGWPAGTLFTFRYLLRRRSNKQDDGDGGVARNPKDCKRIRWQMRNIWTPGGLQMIQVPVCY